MKRIALFASVLVLAAGPALGQTVSIDAKTLETLQARIAALESRVRDLESSDPVKAKQNTAPAPGSSAGKTPAVSAKKPAPKRSYTIQEGDTVSEIARKHGIPRSAFMEANNIREGQQIYIGDQVVIPSPPSGTSKSGATTGQIAQKNNTGNPGAGKFTTYTIKYGDTLSSIARKHKVSVDAIKAANNMNTDRIGGGQKIKIPAPGASSANTVASNTTRKNNNSSPKAGGGSGSGSGAAPPPGKGELLRPNETYGLYTVEQGDTLFSLARDFFTTLQELQRLNEMGSSTVLRPGQDMVVPTSKYFEHHKLAGS